MGTGGNSCARRQTHTQRSENNTLHVDHPVDSSLGRRGEDKGRKEGVKRSKEKSGNESIRGGQTAGSGSVWCLAALEKEDLLSPSKQCIVS